MFLAALDKFLAAASRSRAAVAVDDKDPPGGPVPSAEAPDRRPSLERNDSRGTESCSEASDGGPPAGWRAGVPGEGDADYWRGRTVDLSVEVSTLQREAQEQTAALERLREAMGRAEEARADRAATLEAQISLLLEARRPTSGAVAARRAPPVPSDRIEGDVGDCDPLRHAKIEIAALEELLARVLAERDALAFKSRNLEEAIGEMSRGGEGPGGTSTILSEQKMQGRRYYCHDESEGGAMLYQLSCKLCGQQRAICSTRQDVRGKVKDNFHEIWALVRCDRGEMCEDDRAWSHFARTPFARHVADHCGAVAAREEVVNWCLHNVKVEVLCSSDRD